MVDIDMRRDVQEIFRATPHDKQVMMFSATLSKEIRPVCRKFCQDVRHNFYALRFLEQILTFLCIYSPWKSTSMTRRS